MPEDTEIEESSDVVSENEYDETDVKDDHYDDMMGEQKYRTDEENENGAEVKKHKFDPKDPLRPRRKKARRACYACQRAHLTCGMYLLSNKFRCPTFLPDESHICFIHLVSASITYQRIKCPLAVR